MATNNNWNNKIAAANSYIELNSGTSVLYISTDSANTAVSVATGAGIKSLVMGSTTSTSSTTVQSGSGALNITSTNGAQTHNSGTGTMSISTDATANIVNVATGAGVKTTTLGSTNSTSATTVQSGSGALNITSTNGAITMNSGTGTVAIGNDATAATYNFATGAGAKVVTLGTTNTTSSLALKYGTADFTLASATGTVMSALDTGEITYPLQPAFLAYGSSTESNVTGDGTDYTLAAFASEVFDQNGDFASNTFTAPVTGKYLFSSSILMGGLTSSHTEGYMYTSTSNRIYLTYQVNFGAMRSQPAGTSQFSAVLTSAIADMDAGDTATLHLGVAGGTKVVDIIYNGATDPRTWFSGQLVC